MARRALKISMFGKAWQDAFSSMATRCYIRSLEVYLEIAHTVEPAFNVRKRTSLLEEVLPNLFDQFRKSSLDVR